MGCTVSHEGSVSVVSVAGRFVFDQHREFREAYMAALNRPETRDVELNLGGVEYMDSSALGMMLLMRERLMETGRMVRISHATPFIRGILETANFQRLFEIV